jgi:hypothetical protein
VRAAYVAGCFGSNIKDIFFDSQKEHDGEWGLKNETTDVLYTYI